MHFDYSALNIRHDLPEAYREAWLKIASPGNWWKGEDRVAIAAEVRAARDCSLCAERKSALSPFSVKGQHQATTNLPEVAIDAVHRIVTDVSRLTKTWLEDCGEQGLSKEQYIELLGIVVAVISIDAFHRALGIDDEKLPEPIAGEPSYYLPTSIVEGDAWVPVIPASAAKGTESDLYGGQKQTGNVLSAMSLVPDSVRLLTTLASVQYLQATDVINPSMNGGRKISRAQMELLAGRISSLSSCFY